MKATLEQNNKKLLKNEVDVRLKQATMKKERYFLVIQLFCYVI
jgi:hypothetical protein